MGEVVDLNRFRQGKKQQSESRIGIDSQLDNKRVLNSIKTGFEILYGGKEPEYSGGALLVVKNYGEPSCQYAEGIHPTLNINAPINWIDQRAQEITHQAGNYIGNAFKAYALVSIAMKDEIDQLTEKYDNKFNFSRKTLKDALGNGLMLDEQTAKETLKWRISGSIAYRAIFDNSNIISDTFLDILPAVKEKELNKELTKQKKEGAKGILSRLINGREYKIDSYRLGILCPLEPARLAEISASLQARLFSYD